MDPHWLKLRWPITVLALGGMVVGLLWRSQQDPIQLRLVLSFAEPLRLSGKVDPVRLEAPSGFAVKVIEHAPIDLSVTNRTPVKVQMIHPDPIQIKVDQGKPMVVDIDPQAPVKVKLGL
jgi:hypothetical protein